MSENNHLSIEEIIKRAEKIKAEAERQLDSAEKSLSEKAAKPAEEVVVDEEAVRKRVEEAVRPLEPEEDVKEYVPPKKEETKAFVPKKKRREPEEATDGDEDMKVVTEPFDEEETAPFTPAAEADGKTREIVLNGGDAPAAGAEEKTAVVPDISEKTAVFVTTRTGDAEAEGDLEEIPTIVSKEGLVSAFTAEEEVPEEETGVQMTFEGFDEATDEVETVNEEDVERELEERRREKVGKFRLFGPDETDETLGKDSEVKEDYQDNAERDAFVAGLIQDKKKTRIRVLLGGILGVLLLGLTALKDTSYIPNALSSHTAYFVTALVLYLAVLAVNINVFVHGLNPRKKPNFDLPVSLAALAVLAHTVALAVSSGLWIDNGVLLVGAGAFALCMSQIGKLKMMSRIVDNFEFITSPGDKYTLESITNAVDAKIISRGMLEEEEPRLKMSVKTDFPSNFLDISCKNEPADALSLKVFLADAVLCLALFIALCIRNDFHTALNAALCALCISLPCAALTLSNAQLCDISAQLKSYGSRVCGFAGALAASDANAIVMEAADLFGKNSCGLYGIKTFNKEKVDDAIINAAAVIVQTKSPLKLVFDDVIIGQQSILPPVEDVTYEERLGTSAWIYNKKVLVGTRDLLRAHGVKVPKQSYEDKYTFHGRKALYLAVDGDIIAMFIVSYKGDKQLRRELKKLEKNDIAVIVKSADPYITEESLAELFDLPAGFIRVMNYSSVRAYDKYSCMEVEKSPAYLVHSGTALGLIGALRGAHILVSTRTLIAFLCTFGSLFGLAALATLSVLGAFTQISALGIVAFQAIWTAFMYIIMKLKGLGL